MPLPFYRFILSLIMKKILLYAAAVLISVGLFNACTSKSSETAEESYTVSAADSTAMVSAATEILDLMQNDDYAGAADRLYVFNAADSTLSPLDENRRQELQFRAQVFPVKAYTLYSANFTDAIDNELTFDVAFSEPDAEGNAPTTKIGFNIVSKDGKYYPTLLEKRK